MLHNSWERGERIREKKTTMQTTRPVMEGEEVLQMQEKSFPCSPWRRL